MTPRTLNNNYKKCISNRTFELKNEGGFVFFFVLSCFIKILNQTRRYSNQNYTKTNKCNFPENRSTPQVSS